LIRDLTILLPAYNEARRLPTSLEKALAWADAHKEHYPRVEVMIVDDGSDDGTADVVRARFGDRVRVVRREERGGKGAALRTGILQVRTEWLLFADADLSIPIEELRQLEPFADEAPVVIGSKRAPGSDVKYPGLRRILGKVGQKLIQLLVVRGFYDTQCGFKLFRTDVAQRLFRIQRIDGFGFDFEVLFLARRLKIPVIEVPIRCEHQIGGTVRLSTYVTVLREVAMIWWNRLRGVYPKASGP
jgi:dolichyl-phosphate beta-glucosyltransferase